MIQRRPRPRSESELPDALPPLDGADEEPIAVDDEPFAPPDDEDVSLDDAASDHLDGEGDEEIRTEGESESGWSEGADDADDADVGDLADEIDDEAGAGSWLGEEPGLEADELDDDAADAHLAADDGAEGPEGEEDFAFEGGALDLREDPDDDAAVDPLGEGDLAPDGFHEPAAFALPAPGSPPHAVVHTAGLVTAAAALGPRVVMVGEGIDLLNLGPAAALDGRGLNARRAQASALALIHSVVATSDGALVAAAGDGRFLRSDDAGASWAVLGALFADGARAAALHLLAEGAGPGLWVREHGGGLWHSDDGGRRWLECGLDHPVRAAACERGSPGVLVVTGGRAPAVLRSTDGRHFAATGIELPRSTAPAAVARGAGYTAISFGRGPGLLVPPDGGHPVSWPLLERASALLVAETDDGAPQVIAAVYDETSGQSTLVSAAVDARGAPRHPRRFADLDALLPPTADTADASDDDDDARVEALLALDPGARRVLVITPRGVLVVARAGGAPARPGPTGTDD